MTKPGFRTGGGRSGGSREPNLQIAGSPFSQAQILHLMKTEFARARRYHFPVSCLLMQPDRLATLADLHGADLRDQVRRAFARLVRDKTRGADHLGLVADDRFLLVLPHTAREQARVVAERLCMAFSQLEVASGEQTVPVTLSVGGASCEDQDTLFFETLLAQAETALERAVGGGGDRVVWFGSELHARMTRATDTTERRDEHPPGGRREDDRRNPDRRPRG